MSFKKLDSRQNFPELEEKILKFWNKEKIFEKSVEEKSRNKTFSFYDGPPFATGLPHYGHLLAGFIKDVIPRYKAMKGYRVERVWGWDTHGLPIENIVEQELGIKTKKEIENYGIGKFNEKCRSKVLHYAEEWKKIVNRTGRWVDMENAYLTMDSEYMESVWWVFKSLWDKKLVYKGYKVMPYCPRCSTPLSNFELGLNYKDISDPSTYVKFPVADEKQTYFLVWTTTPWTLPGNVALVIGRNINYVKVKHNNEILILAEERLSVLDDDYKIIEKFKGRDLEQKSYKGPYKIPDYRLNKADYKVYPADFVSTEDGTGIVHIAPPFGEDDMALSKKYFLTSNHSYYIDSEGKILKDSDLPGQGKFIKESNNDIINDLGKRKLLYKNEVINHSYPHCYRCETPLIYKAVSSWLINVQKNKKKLLALNKKIKWVPDFIGKGRFHKILEGAPDWNVSRNRFWGTPLPIWQCEKCGNLQIFDSIKELEKVSGTKITDIHLHKLKPIVISCDKCSGKAKISGEVLDCWFESGSMPYASVHYPQENKNKFERDFPTDFIAEGIDQTRGWFNSLLILACDIFDNLAFKNVLVNGIVLAEDGQKMSKRLQNYPDPMDIIHKYGADALRFYLVSSPAVRADNLRFSEKEVDEIFKKLILTLWNSYSFFVTYARIDKFRPVKETKKPKNIMDQWILSEVEDLKMEVTRYLEEYQLDKATRLFWDFLDDLSNWYIRRSRRRFWKSENDQDKKESYQTLYYVLVNYAKLLAPFMPFLSDEIYKNLTGEKSVHLTNWPEINKELINKKLMEEMVEVREIVRQGLAIRAEKGIKVRQPLRKLKVKPACRTGRSSKLKAKELIELIKEEVNVKELGFGNLSSNLKKVKEEKAKVGLDITITMQLKQEGLARELVRQIQEMRKKADFNIEDRIETYYQTNDKELEKAIKVHVDNNDYSIKKETLSLELASKKPPKTDYQEDILINKKKIWIELTKK